MSFRPPGFPSLPGGRDIGPLLGHTITGSRPQQPGRVPRNRQKERRGAVWHSPFHPLSIFARRIQWLKQYVLNVM